MSDTVVTTSVGANPDHPVDLMLDDDLDTFYLSADHPKTDDWIMLDLGAPRAIAEVTLYPGTSTSSWYLHSGVLEYSNNMTSWTQLATVPYRVAKFDHYADTPVTARYLRLRSLYDQGHRIAIRSFEVRAPATLRSSTVADPFPLRASTFAVPEYGKLVFSFTGPAGSDSSTAVRCKSILIKVPTGRRPEALTSSPTRIRSGAAPVAGEEQGYHWNVTRISTDPEVTVFRCRPEVTARFHAGWTLAISLASIEINGAGGTAHIDIEEETALPETPGEFMKRANRYPVVKSADEFYFENLRPRSAVIGWNRPVDLLWHGSGNATYRMFYRGADGNETSVEVANGFWPSPACRQNASFTLEATTSGGEKRYLTTSVKVEGGEVDAAHLRVTGTLTTPRLVADDENVIDFAGSSGLSIEGSLTVEKDGILVGAEYLSVRGDVEIEGKLTVDARVEVNGTFLPGHRLSLRDVAVTLLSPRYSAPTDGTTTGPQGRILVVTVPSTAEGPSTGTLQWSEANAEIVAEVEADSGDTATPIFVEGWVGRVNVRRRKPDSAGSAMFHQFGLWGRRD
ncbi:discoidin domain-containing protein [Nocardia sp. NBC_01009]|uniref:discoidin domain-containing protein n=1 Tax=Nocardia sp. NBC_01009 TaxID=2975996 RepID=UPI00386DC5CF|nr:discoidin domain-containing protein [Nocardia sp. NBC_01009]